MPLCPACNEPMKEYGRAFRCEPCRQIVAFYKMPARSPYFLLSTPTATNGPTHDDFRTNIGPDS
jgi:hypothetical protein